MQVQKTPVTATTSLLLLLLASSAHAQHYGQWSWEAQLGGGKRSYDNLLGSTPASSYDEGSLGLDLDVNGFILHPSFLKFRTSLDLYYSSYAEGSAPDTFRWGGRAELSYRPRGNTPTTLYFGKQLYDYSQVTGDDPLSLVRLPDSVTSFGGRLRVRRGLLNGLLAGYDGSLLSYAGAGTKDGRQQLAFLEWARASHRFQRSARLDWRSDDYALADYGISSLTGGYNHFGNLSDSWRWQMSLWGTHQTLDYAQRRSGNDNIRLVEVFQRPSPTGDLVELRYDGGYSQSTASLQTHRVEGRRQWRVRPGWFVSPFAAFGLQLSEGKSVSAPQAGVATNWQGRRGAIDLNTGGSLSYLLVTPGVLGTGSESRFAFDASASAGHGDDSRLRQELTLSASHNRFRLAGEAPADRPELNSLLIGTGTESRLRARLELRRRWRGVSASLWGETQRSEPTGTFESQLPGLQQNSGVLQLIGRRFSLTANVGDTRTTGLDQQSVRYFGGSVALRPLRLVSLTGSYRADKRNVSNAPAVDGDRYEAGADVRLGAFILRGLLFRTTERGFAGQERTNRGFNVALARRFRGWLPIVTQPFSQGDVR